MKATKILGVFMAILLISCSSDPKESNVKTSESSTYKISELPTLPDFARPISRAGEERQFTLIKNDETEINFNLKSIEETFFGKRRTLVGTATVGKNKPENAVMVVGENGFELLFRNKGEQLMLKGKNELNVGYEMLDLNFDAQSKKEFLSAAKKEGYDGEVLLRDYLDQQNAGKQVRNNYDVIVEKSKNYDLIDQSSTQAIARKNALKNGQIEDCMSILPPSAISKSPEPIKMHLANKSGMMKRYNIEFTYIEYPSAYVAYYLSLIDSFFDLGGKLKINKEEYSPYPNLIRYKPENTPAAKAQYLAAFAKVPDGSAQIRKLAAYIKARPTKYGNKILRCALFYNCSWDNQTHGGVAYFDTYGNDLNGSEESSLIFGTIHYNGFVHECGHNLGAVHAENSSDVMYRQGSDKIYHFDAANLKAIENCISRRWGY